MHRLTTSIAVALFSCTALTMAGDLATIPPGSKFFAAADLQYLVQTGDLNQGLPSLEPENGNRKSAGKAALLSLALPGLGEVYTGNLSRAVGFFVSEGGIWSTFALFKLKAHWLRDDYINYAVQYAGIDPNGKDDKFYDKLAFYDNRDEYNKVSRAYTPTNPFYPETPDWDWQWLSDANRQAYRDIKNSSKAQSRNANYALGLAFANRVISAIDAWRCAKSQNRRSSGLSQLRFRLSPAGLGSAGGAAVGLMVNCSYSF